MCVKLAEEFSTDSIYIYYYRLIGQHEKSWPRLSQGAYWTDFLPRTGFDLFIKKMSEEADIRVVPC